MVQQMTNDAQLREDIAARVYYEEPQLLVLREYSKPRVETITLLLERMVRLLKQHEEVCLFLDLTEIQAPPSVKMRNMIQTVLHEVAPKIKFVVIHISPEQKRIKITTLLVKVFFPGRIQNTFNKEEGLEICRQKIAQFAAKRASSTA